MSADSFNSEEKPCRVCTQMRQRKPSWKQAGLSWICLLCSHPYCEKHKGKEEGVCDINHITYYSKHSHYPDIYRSLHDREMKLGYADLIQKAEGLPAEESVPLGEGDPMEPVKRVGKDEYQNEDDIPRSETEERRSRLRNSLAEGKT